MSPSSSGEDIRERRTHMCRLRKGVAVSRAVLLEQLMKTQEELFRLTGKITPLYAFVCDSDFDLIWKESTRNIMGPYPYTKVFAIAPDIFVCRERAVVV